MHFLTGKILRLSPSIETRDLPDGTRLMKQIVRAEYLALTPAQQRIFNLFDGHNTVEEVLHNLLIQGQHPGIRAFYDLVLNGITKGFLCEAAEAASALGPKAQPARLPAGGLGSIGFSLLLIVVGGAVLGWWILTGSEALGWTDLVAGQNALLDWFKVLLFLSLGLSSSYALAGSVLTNFGRQAYAARIRWDRLVPFFALDTRDAFMGGRLCEIAVALRALAAPLLLAAISWLVESEAGMLASCFTGLILGSPFGGTPAHNLLHALFRIEYQLPRCAEKFLNTKLFAQMFNWNEKLVEEKYLLTHSTYAICWLGVLFQFASGLLERFGNALIRNLSQQLAVASQAALMINIALLALVIAATIVFACWLVGRGVYRLLAPRLFPAESGLLRRHVESTRPTEDLVLRFLGHNLLFCQLAPDVLKSVAQAMKHIVVQRGTKIIRERDPGDAMFLVYAGRVEVTKEDEAGQEQAVATLGPGDVFGEIALLDQVPRTSNVRSTEITSLFVLSKADFERLLVTALGAEKIKEIVQVCAFLRRNKLFSDWHPQALMNLAHKFAFQDFPAGGVVIQQDLPNEFFYLVYAGEFAVRKDGQPVATLGPGDFCGEISLLRDMPATAEVAARHAGRCLKLGKEDFLRFVSHDFLTGLAIEKALEARLEERKAA